MTRKLMRWAMKDWSRVEKMNLMGTGAASLQIDILPGIFCAGHFTVTWRNPRAQAPTPEDLLRAGERLQRFWLTATMLGLALQPGLAPIAFATHAVARRTLHRTAEASGQGGKAGGGSRPGDRVRRSISLSSWAGSAGRSRCGQPAGPVGVRWRS